MHHCRMAPVCWLAYFASWVMSAPMWVLQARSQLLGLEDTVPWNAVKSSWRSRRPGWRRSLKSADTAAEIATRLEEFRAHLMNDGATLPVTLCTSTTAWACIMDPC